jgi:hypothetical protein
MICPLCNSDSIVIRTYDNHRERMCLVCRARWTTIERLMEITEIPPQMVLDLGSTRRKKSSVASATGEDGAFVKAPPPAPATESSRSRADGTPEAVRS